MPCKLGTQYDLMYVENLPCFTMTDQPETCPQCGRRTEWLDVGDKQVHVCHECEFMYVLEEE